MSVTTPAAARSTRAGRRPLGRHAVGGLYLFTAGVHVGLVGADPQAYAGFADAALVPGLRTAWDEVFLAHPAAWGLATAALELAIALLLLLGRGHWRSLGWVLVIGFHVALMAFGWGFWLWSVPFLALFGPAAVDDLRADLAPGRPDPA
jgi:hypothetical protein